MAFTVETIPDAEGKPSNTATREEMAWHNLPMGMRDHCSALAIKWRVCQQKQGFWPWNCHDEKAHWEVCEYEELLKRFNKANNLKSKLVAKRAEEMEMAAVS